MPKNIALIFCRGGSKGIPGKNIKLFSGKPLLHWILKRAIETNIFDEIILSTDNKEIASLGQQNGAIVPFLRPAELSQDHSDQFDAHKHAIDFLKLTDRKHNICILNNNPFLQKQTILNGFTKALEQRFERVVVDGIEVPGDYLYFRQLKKKADFYKIEFNDLFLNSKINRQKDNKLFIALNNMRWAKPSQLVTYEVYKNHIAQNGLGLIKVSKLENFDLDTSEDWLIAEAVFKETQYSIENTLI